jgi:putative PIN family toxin of toxin-antitoxin system
MRAVVDTNVWISAILNPAGPPARLLTAVREGRLDPVTSEPLLAELAGVLARPRLARRFGVTPAKIGALLALLRERAELVPVTGTLRLCRDPDDDLVIETAVRGRAAALVSRDDDLKGASDVVAAPRAQGVAVLTVRRALALLDAARPGA